MIAAGTFTVAAGLILVAAASVRLVLWWHERTQARRRVRVAYRGFAEGAAEGHAEVCRRLSEDWAATVRGVREHE